MKKLRVSITMSYETEYEDDWMKNNDIPATLDGIRKCDYDNIVMPLNKCKDIGWTIIDSHVEIQ